MQNIQEIEKKKQKSQLSS